MVFLCSLQTAAEVLKYKLSTKMSFGIVEPVVTWILAHPGFLAVCFLLYCFVFALSLFFNVPKPGPNPFKKDSRRPVEPLVKDQKVRDRLLKQGE